MLSIIIPTLNEEKYLPRLLDSIRAQNYDDYEVIVSDGFSEDNTAHIAKERGCVLVQNEERGPAKQRNRGAKYAQGDILLFLDADSLLLPDFLNKAVTDFQEQNLDCASFYIKIRGKKEKSKRLYNFYSQVYNLAANIGQNIKTVSVGAAIMASKEMHDRIHGFDESIYVGEDYDYTDRIRRLGRYRVLKHRFVFSARRFEEEGNLTFLVKVIYTSLYVIFTGRPIRKQIIRWDFGRHK